MTEAKRELATISGSKFGVGDRDRCWLQFQTKTLDGNAAMQYLEIDEAAHLLEHLHIGDVRNLDGHVVVVRREGTEGGGMGTMVYAEGFC